MQFRAYFMGKAEINNPEKLNPPVVLKFCIGTKALGLSEKHLWGAFADGTALGWHTLENAIEIYGEGVKITASSTMCPTCEEYIDAKLNELGV